jgi:hypothetical protein
MAIKIKRRNSGAALAIGTAPLTTGTGGLGSGEMVFDAVGNILYIGSGDDGAGNCTVVLPLAGPGNFNTRGMNAAPFLIMN